MDRCGFFFTYDLLYWTITRPSATTIGDTASEGVFDRNGVAVQIENSLDTSFIDGDFHSGHRFEFG